MEKLICKECGKVFTYKKIQYCKSQLTKHIKIEHSMSVEEYVVKHEYDGEHPTCPCGCGHLLKLQKGGKRWEFNKYYADTCYGGLVRRKNNEILEHFKDGIKGEIVCMVYADENSQDKELDNKIKELKTKGFRDKEISVILSTLFNLNKNEVYKRSLEL